MEKSGSDASLIWISGATEGIGLGLSRTVPYPHARIVNLSRRPHPNHESQYLDLADPAGWDAVGRHFSEMLANFNGRRAIFIQNAHLRGLTAFVGETTVDSYAMDITANLVAPLRLGDLFLRAAIESGYGGEVGLVMMSSASARAPNQSQSVYCAGKAALEMWVRVVRRENIARGRDRFWVTAVRPGFVDTGLTRHLSAMPDDLYPLAPAMRAQFASDAGVLGIDEAAGAIWAALPTDRSLLTFGAQVGQTA